jgi:hypothetical protein
MRSTEIWKSTHQQKYAKKNEQHTHWWHYISSNSLNIFLWKFRGVFGILNVSTQLLEGLLHTMRSACATHRNVLDVTNLTVGAQFLFVGSLPSAISMDPVCITNSRHNRSLAQFHRRPHLDKQSRAQALTQSTKRNRTKFWSSSVDCCLEWRTEVTQGQFTTIVTTLVATIHDARGQTLTDWATPAIISVSKLLYHATRYRKLLQDTFTWKHSAVDFVNIIETIKQI